MKNVIIMLIIITAVAGCKKKLVKCGAVCQCIKNVADSIQSGPFDSATFYQNLLGTWYLKEADTPLTAIGCPHHCYCDAPYPVIFLSNNTFVMNFAGNIKDTFQYSFNTVSPHQIANQSYFYIYGNDPGKGQIQYINSNFMIIQLATAATSEDFESCPAFYLTKH